MRLVNKKIALLVEEGFEDLEFWVTVMRLRKEGAQVTIVGLVAGKSVRGKNGLAVVVPGGWAPDKLRRYSAVTGLVKRAYEQNKIVGLICHAGLVGITAGIVRGDRATGASG